MKLQIALPANKENFYLKISVMKIVLLDIMKIGMLGNAINAQLRDVQIVLHKANVING